MYAPTALPKIQLNETRKMADGEKTETLNLVSKIQNSLVKVQNKIVI